MISHKYHYLHNDITLFLKSEEYECESIWFNSTPCWLWKKTLDSIYVINCLHDASEQSRAKLLGHWKQISNDSSSDLTLGENNII